MNDKKMIGANIRAFRNAFGETQEELADIVGVTRKAINNYERGIREPNRDTLDRIAKHYMIPVENIEKYDFSDMEIISIDDKLFLEKLNYIFPIFNSNPSMNNKHFKRAYENHKRLYEEFGKVNLENINRLHRICLKEYEKSYKEEKTSEAIANKLSIYFFILCGVQAIVLFLENKDSVIMQTMKKNPKYKKAIEDMEQILDGEIEEYKEVLHSPELLKSINDSIKTLKDEKEWIELADYYRALQYVFNIIDDGMEMERKCKAGLDMLNRLSFEGNEYASNYMEYSFDALGISPQIVDEWRFW